MKATYEDVHIRRTCVILVTENRTVSP